MQVRYAPDAVVYNMGPETVSDFVKQRRRNYAGHLYLKDKYGYQVSSLQNTRVVRIALEEVWGAVRLVWTLGVLGTLEIYSRMLGVWDYRVRKKQHVVWDMAWSTKDPGKGVEEKEATS
jgi:cellulose synthase/poly-beta-1,6-N-acetylglucosamine synthase-like glycosyltransferase